MPAVYRHLIIGTLAIDGMKQALKTNSVLDIYCISNIADKNCELFSVKENERLKLFLFLLLRFCFISCFLKNDLIAL